MIPKYTVIIASLLIFYLSHGFGQKKRLNVLFLISDDMRPEIGVFGDCDSYMHTHNLDRLAASSLIFRNAFVQQAVCSPSRTSLLTGRRPDTTRVYDLTQYWRQVAGNFTTLPQYFKENGYATAGLGKVFHPGRASGKNDPLSWTETYYTPDESYWNNRNHNSWMAVGEEELKEHPLPDMQTADEAVKMMDKLASRKDVPFFLAVGFLKPHLPFLFPAKFMDFYPVENITLPRNPFAPIDMPEIAWSNFDELRKYENVLDRYGHGSINSTLPKELILKLRRAYYSSISYVDSLVGRLLSALSNLGLENDTIVSFIGDHGWQLGEHGEWCKHTNFERATRAPMMLHVPNLTEHGFVTDALVEFVDLFSTIVEAADLRVPDLCPDNSSSILLCTEGTSMMPLIRNPHQHWKQGVFSQYPRMLVSGDVLMGYSLRTPGYRYTEWVFYDTVEFHPLWEKKREYRELYDHDTDPEENVNVVNLPQYSKLVKTLSKKLREGWRAAIPTVAHV